MAKTKCANCGEQMIEAYTRVGLRILICSHVKMSTTKRISGAIRQGEIYCGMNIQGLRASFETLTSGSDLTLEALRKATNETVPSATLLESANLALMLGLPADQLAELFEAATKLGFAVGIPTTKAIEALCRGVGRRSRLILDNIGIAFKAQEAYDWFAREHNLEKLDEAQRTEAWQKYAIKLIKEKAKVLA
jgi:hypothetical protein